MSNDFRSIHTKNAVFNNTLTKGGRIMNNSGFRIEDLPFDVFLKYFFNSNGTETSGTGDRYSPAYRQVMSYGYEVHALTVTKNGTTTVLSTFRTVLDSPFSDADSLFLTQREGYAITDSTAIASYDATTASMKTYVLPFSFRMRSRTNGFTLYPYCAEKQTASDSNPTFYPFCERDPSGKALLNVVHDSADSTDANRTIGYFGDALHTEKETDAEYYDLKSGTTIIGRIYVNRALVSQSFRKTGSTIEFGYYDTLNAVPSESYFSQGNLPKDPLMKFKLFRDHYADAADFLSKQYDADGNTVPSIPSLIAGPFLYRTVSGSDDENGKTMLLFNGTKTAAYAGTTLDTYDNGSVCSMTKVKPYVSGETFTESPYAFACKEESIPNDIASYRNPDEAYSRKYQVCLEDPATDAFDIHIGTSSDLAAYVKRCGHNGATSSQLSEAILLYSCLYAIAATVSAKAITGGTSELCFSDAPVTDVLSSSFRRKASLPLYPVFMNYLTTYASQLSMTDPVVGGKNQGYGIRFRLFSVTSAFSTLCDGKEFIRCFYEGNSHVFHVDMDYRNTIRLVPLLQYLHNVSTETEYQYYPCIAGLLPNEKCRVLSLQAALRRINGESSAEARNGFAIWQGTDGAPVLRYVTGSASFAVPENISAAFGGFDKLKNAGNSASMDSTELSIADYPEAMLRFGRQYAESTSPAAEIKKNVVNDIYAESMKSLINDSILLGDDSVLAKTFVDTAAPHEMYILADNQNSKMLNYYMNDAASAKNDEPTYTDDEGRTKSGYVPMPYFSTSMPLSLDSKVSYSSYAVETSDEALRYGRQYVSDLGVFSRLANYRNDELNARYVNDVARRWDMNRLANESTSPILYPKIKSTSASAKDYSAQHAAVFSSRKKILIAFSDIYMSDDAKSSFSVDSEGNRTYSAYVKYRSSYIRFLKDYMGLHVDDGDFGNVTLADGTTEDSNAETMTRQVVCGFAKNMSVDEPLFLSLLDEQAKLTK